VFSKNNHIKLFLFTIVLGLQSAQAQTHVYALRELQAAYIYNFAKYIKWPADSDQFVIGVYGDDELLLENFDMLNSKKVGGKPIVVKKIKSPEDILTCHIAYLPQSNSSKLEKLLRAAEGHHVLIVTEDDMIKKGASISFTVINNALKFKLKESTLTAAGLTASQGLLKLAILL
jgi:hypothetical protein